MSEQNKAAKKFSVEVLEDRIAPSAFLLGIGANVRVGDDCGYGHGHGHSHGSLISAKIGAGLGNLLGAKLGLRIG